LVMRRNRVSTRPVRADRAHLANPAEASSDLLMPSDRSTSRTAATGSAATGSTVAGSTVAVQAFEALAVPPQ